MSHMEEEAASELSAVHGTTRACGGRWGCSRQCGQPEQKPGKEKSRDLFLSCFRPTSALCSGTRGPCSGCPGEVSSPPFWGCWKTRPFFFHIHKLSLPALSPQPHAPFSVPHGILSPAIRVWSAGDSGLGMPPPCYGSP